MDCERESVEMAALGEGDDAKSVVGMGRRKWRASPKQLAIEVHVQKL